MAYHISIAENDDNGTPQGWAERIQLGELMLENILIGGRSPKISFDGKRLKVGAFSCDASRAMWAGNMCWNMYYVAWTDAMDILNYLMKLKWWDCTEGPCNQFDKFRAKQPFNAGDMEEIRA